MPVIACLLRGVNVGGKNVIRMEDLRALCISLGLHDPRTSLQSGNVVFRTDQPDLAALSARIEQAIEKRFGLRAEVILRLLPELRAIVKRNPFTGVDPARLLVTFLARDPSPSARAALLAVKAGPEQLRFGARELYLHLPNGVARAKLSSALIDKTLKVPTTGRNWNTITKLLDLAEEMERASPG